MATFVIVFLTTRMILLLLIHYYVIKIVIKHVVIKKLKINLIKLNVKNVVVQMENMEINTQLKMKYLQQHLLLILLEQNIRLNISSKHFFDNNEN